MRIRKHPYLLETIWMDKCKFDEAERCFHEAQQALAVGRVAQEAELEQGGWPAAGEVEEEGWPEREAGKKRRRKRSPRAKPAADTSCPDRRSPEEAERARRLRVSGFPGPNGATPGRETRPLAACHQLSCGVWVNKGAFDEAERLFVVRSQARSVPRSLPIPGSGIGAVPKPWATPDEGYVSATPATPGFPDRMPVTPATPDFPDRMPVTPGFPDCKTATPATPGFPDRMPVTPGFPDRKSATPGFPDRMPVTPGFPDRMLVTPATPGFPDRMPVTPATPGFPDCKTATPGFPDRMPVTPATPGFPDRKTATPGFPDRMPVTPGFPDRKTATPGFPDRMPVTPATPDFHDHMPVTPATPGFPDRKTATPATPGFPDRMPVTPATPGFPDRMPVTPATPGFPDRMPVTPATPGFPDRMPVTPGFPDRMPVTPGFPDRMPVTPATPGFPDRVPVTPATPGFPSRPPVVGMFPGAAHRPLVPEAWLEKPLYDEAERLYYEMLHGGPDTGAESAGPTLPESSPLPARGRDHVAAARYHLHPDSEPVWFNKPAYHAAELHYHLAGIRRAAGGIREPVSRPRPPPKKPAPALHCAGLRDKTMAVNFLAEEKIWFDKYKYDDAEMQYYTQLNAPTTTTVENSLATQISSVWEADSNPKEAVQNNVSPVSSHSAVQGADIELCTRVTSLEKENQNLHKVVEELRLALAKLEIRLSTVERSPASTKPAVCPPAPRQPVPQEAKEDDNDIDLFGSSDEEENAESERIREQRLLQYAEKKSKKPALIAKSSILLDVKPWDDETDMVKLEECVRTVQLVGLLWGSSKLVPVGYGIRKLQIQCVVEDDKVGTDQLEEEITKFEDYVQSVDVAAFNKI
uniref:eukaryotic translation elongation factor 1 delta b (guanine nucleotide exchange protein) isoform X2 n=1 Tax=Pristiophorus japonicus TaxID=55135 RepID=UPI00398E4484